MEQAQRRGFCEYFPYIYSISLVYHINGSLFRKLTLKNWRKQKPNFNKSNKSRKRKMLQHPLMPLHHKSLLRKKQGWKPRAPTTVKIFALKTLILPMGTSRKTFAQVVHDRNLTCFLCLDCFYKDLISICLTAVGTDSLVETDSGKPHCSE